MSTIKTNNVQHVDATSANIALDSSGNVTLANNLTVDTNTLFVNATNNRVGIGTTSPSTEFHVSNSVIARVGIGSSYPMMLYTDSSGAGEDPAIYWISGKGLRFATSTTGLSTAGGTERARIDSSGRLLVGTSSESSTSLLAIRGSTSGSGDTGSIFLRNGLADASVAGSYAMGRILFGNNDGECARIDTQSEAGFTSSSRPGRLMFLTTASGATTPTERMRIDSNGAVGIGAAAGANAKRLHVIGSGDDNTPVVNITRNTSGGGGVGSEEVALNVYAPSCQNNSTSTGIKVYASASLETASYAIDAEVAKTNNGTFRAARFKGGQGNVGGYGYQTVVDIIANVAGTGTNGAVRGLYIENPAYSGATNTGITIANLTTAAVTHNAIQFVRGSSEVGSIRTTTSGTSFNTSSDYRLKENIVNLDNAISRLSQIPVHRFNFINTPDVTVDGFLAHEVQGFVPEAVTGKKDETKIEQIVDENNQPVLDDKGDLTFRTVPVYQAIDQSKLVPLLTAALQEAIGRIETLESEVAALKATINP